MNVPFRWPKGVTIAAMVFAGVVRAQDRGAPDAVVGMAETRRPSVAYAPPMKPPTLDGKFDDWPANAPRYPVLTNYGPYGPTDLDRANLLDNKDLAAWFMVGYNAKENLIYVAIHVRDDVLVIGHGYDKTDGVEIYVQAPHSHQRRVILPVGIGLTALQYSGVPGEGSTNGDGANLGMLWGDASKTRTKFAHRRDQAEGVTNYEFAVEPFVRFNSSAVAQARPGSPVNVAANEPAKLLPMMRLGFDLAVVDKDNATDPPSMLVWGPIGAEKYFNPTIIGDLVLLDDKEPARVHGRVTDPRDQPRRGLALQIFDAENQPAGVATTDADGVYDFKLPPGDYYLAPAGCQGVGRDLWNKVSLRAGDAKQIDLVAADLEAPPSLLRAIERYGKMRTYADVTTVTVSKDNVTRDVPLSFDFISPNTLRIGYAENALIRTAGEELRAEREGAIIDRLAQPERIGVLELTKVTEKLAGDPGLRIELPGLRVQGGPALPAIGVLGGLPVHQALLSGEPKRVLLGDADSIRVVGEMELRGESCMVVEITRPASNLIPRFPYWGEQRGEVMAVRHWVSDRDGLIHRTEFEFDFIAALHSAFRGDMAGNPNRRTNPMIVHYTIDHDVRTAKPAAK